ncbi:MAG: hypothetical protein PF692_01155 [Kiritimatiellae bacterium]|jgi:hypothetical protein|nr:hypothetical protein [Kiritimatiellia bacterium]
MTQRVEMSRFTMAIIAILLNVSVSISANTIGKNHTSDAGGELEWGALSNSTIYIILGSHQDLGWETNIAACTELRDTKLITPVLDWMESAWPTRRQDGPKGNYIDYSYSMEHMLCLMEYLDRHPDKLETIKKFTSAGQFSWGATYNCPYESLLSSEALVRQVYLGRKWLRKTLGTNCNTRVAWNPDAPARSLQMPQILKKAGIDYLIISRIDTGFVDWQSPDGESGVIVLSNGHYAQPWLYDNNNGLLVPYAYKEKADTGTAPIYQTSLDLVISNVYDYWTAPQAIAWRVWQGHSYMAKAWSDYINNPDYNLPAILPILYTVDMGKPSPYLGVTNGPSYASSLILDWATRTELPNMRMSTGELALDDITQAAELKGSTFKQWTGERPNLWLYIHGPSHHYAISAMREASRLLPEAETFATIDHLLSGSFSNYPSATLEDGWKDAIYPDIGWGGNDGYSTDSNFLAHTRSAQLVGEQVLQSSIASIAENITFSRTNAIPIVVFNALGWDRSDPVVFTTSSYSNTWSVVDAAGQSIPHQFLRTGLTVTNVVTGIVQSNMTELVFIAFDIPSMGYKTYYLIDEADSSIPASATVDATHYSNDYYDVQFQPGGMESLFDRELGWDVLTDSVRGNALFKTNFLGAELFMMYSDGQGAGEWLEIQQPYPNIFFNKMSDIAGNWTISESGPVRDVYEYTAAVDTFFNYPGTALLDKYIQHENTTQAVIQCSINQKLIFYRDLKRLDCEVSILDWEGPLYVEWRMAFPVNLEKGLVSYDVPMGTIQVGRDEIPGVAGAAYSSQDCSMIHPREVQNFISTCDTNLSRSVTLSSSVAVCDYYFAPTLFGVYAPCGGEQWTAGYTNVVCWTPMRTTLETTIYNKLHIDLYKNNIFYSRIATNFDNHAFHGEADGNAYFNWNIPTNIPTGDDYKILLCSAEDDSIKLAVSRSSFSISSPTPEESTGSSSSSPETLNSEHGPDADGLILNPMLQPILLATRTSCNIAGNPYKQIGDHNFKFSILSHSISQGLPPSNLDSRQFAMQSNDPLQPVVSTLPQPQASLSEEMSFCSVYPENIMITAFKKRDNDAMTPAGEDDQNVIIRLCNMDGTNTEAEVNFFFTANGAYKTSIIEEMLAYNGDSQPELGNDGKFINWDIGKYAIETLSLTPGAYLRFTDEGGESGGYLEWNDLGKDYEYWIQSCTSLFNKTWVDAYGPTTNTRWNWSGATTTNTATFFKVRADTK